MNIFGRAENPIPAVAPEPNAARLAPSEDGSPVDAKSAGNVIELHELCSHHLSLATIDVLAISLRHEAKQYRGTTPQSLSKVVPPGGCLLNAAELKDGFKNIGGAPQYLASVEEQFRFDSDRHLHLSPRSKKALRLRASRIRNRIADLRTALGQALEDDEIGWFLDFGYRHKITELKNHLGWWNTEFGDQHLMLMLEPVHSAKGGSSVKLFPFYYAVPALLLHLQFMTGKSHWRWIGDWADNQRPEAWNVEDFWKKAKPRTDAEWDALPAEVDNAFSQAVSTFLHGAVEHRISEHGVLTAEEKQLLKEIDPRKRWRPRSTGTCQDPCHRNPALPLEIVTQEFSSPRYAYGLPTEAASRIFSPPKSPSHVPVVIVGKNQKIRSAAHGKLRLIDPMQFVREMNEKAKKRLG